mgnify:CR=1 FL=1
MDDMNMNNEPPVYDSGDMKPTNPIPTADENDAGLTEELPMYEDTPTGDRGGRKKIIAIAAGVVLIAGLGIGAFALSSHKTANTQPAEQEQTVAPYADIQEERHGSDVYGFRIRPVAVLCSSVRLFREVHGEQESRHTAVAFMVHEGRRKQTGLRLKFL